MRIRPEESQQVLGMTEQPGWQVVKREIEARIDAFMQQFRTTELQDLRQAVALQSEIRGLTWVLTFVENRLKEAEKE